MESENSKFNTLLNLVTQRFDTIFNADNTLDQKAGTLMGFEIAIIIGYLTLFVSQLQGVKFFEGMIGILFLTVSTVLLIIISWPCRYFFASQKLTSNEENLNKDEKPLLLQLISDGEAANDKNYKILKRKATLYKIAIILLLIGSFLLILSKLNKFYV